MQQIKGLLYLFENILPVVLKIRENNELDSHISHCFKIMSIQWYILFSELHVLYDTCCLDIIRGTDFVCMHWRVISHNCTFRDFEHYRLESLDRCR